MRKAHPALPEILASLKAIPPSADELKFAETQYERARDERFSHVQSLIGATGGLVGVGFAIAGGHVVAQLVFGIILVASAIALLRLDVRNDIAVSAAKTILATDTNRNRLFQLEAALLAAEKRRPLVGRLVTYRQVVLFLSVVNILTGTGVILYAISQFI